MLKLMTSRYCRSWMLGEAVITQHPREVIPNLHSALLQVMLHQLHE
jgi:hypothetical protein